MAEGDCGSSIPTEQLILGGHEVTYNLRFQDFPAREGMLYTHEHNTQCRTMRTSWNIELTCERMKQGYYKFSIKIRRTDPSDVALRASLQLEFFDARGLRFLRPILDDGFRMARGDELRRERRLLQEEIFNGTSVTVTITIEGCHSGAECFKSYDY